MQTASEEIVVKLPLFDAHGYPCPHCMGLGHMLDGMASFSTTEFRYRPATVCPICKGKKRVNVVPLED